MLLNRGPFNEAKLGKWPERSVTKLPDLIRFSASLVKIVSMSEMLVVPFAVCVCFENENKFELN